MNGWEVQSGRRASNSAGLGGTASSEAAAPHANCRLSCRRKAIHEPGRGEHRCAVLHIGSVPFAQRLLSRGSAALLSH